MKSKTPDTLWNTRYLNAIVEDLRARGFPVEDVDLARLSPLGHAHLNCLGRYAFAAPTLIGLRPLRDPPPATTRPRKTSEHAFVSEWGEF